MKTLAILLLLLAADDTLVDAAKDAKAKRKKSTTRVLTNADVKKSKGKIATTPNVSGDVKPEPTLMEKHTAARAAEKAAADQRAASDALIAALEKDLAAIEQSYYHTNDLDYRDTVLAKRFNETKAKLDAAKLAAGSSQLAGKPSAN